MSRRLELKASSSIAEAAFLLAHSAIIFFKKGGQTHRRYLYKDKASEEPTFEKLLEHAKQASWLFIQDADDEKARIDLHEQMILDFYRQFLPLPERPFEIFFYTALLKDVQALAKEIRADRAVARAAKKPAKPKADLKTRRDII